MNSKKNKLPLSVTVSNDNVIVVVDGDATMKVSHIMKKFMMDLMDESIGENRNFKIDLSNCNYMDSTFTGILIILEKYAKNKLHSRFEILNPSKFCYGVLETMGLLPLFKISEHEGDYKGKTIQLKPFHIEKLEEAILMYLAHEELSSINENNKKEFKDVQKFLKQHIETETGKDIDEIDKEDLDFLEREDITDYADEIDKMEDDREDEDSEDEDSEDEDSDK